MPQHLTAAERSAADRVDVERFVQALDVANITEHVVGLSAQTPRRGILASAGPGAVVVGPYAGELRLDGERLMLAPGMGWHALDGWVAAATSLPTSTHDPEDTAYRQAALTAMLWVRAVDGASRHGPPALRRDIAHVGTNVRGRLDVRKTVRIRAQGGTAAASIFRTRDLDNPVTRVIVAADRVLTRQVGHGHWRTDRVEAMLPQLYGAVGRRTPVPTDAELQRLRYTPITRPFKWAAAVSSRIVAQDPVATTPRPGRVQGLVLDLESVWLHAILAWARDARPDLRIESVDRCSFVLGDARRRTRGTMRLAEQYSADGGPVVELTTDSPTDTIHLPARAPAAVTVVREALAGL